MTEQWVVNASPLIALARIGHEHLLTKLASKILIPRAVAEEIEAGPDDDLARQALATNSFLVKETPPPIDDLLAWDLGSGETAVVSQVISDPSWPAILDDRLARKCAQSFGVKVKGTLAVVMIAKQRALIPSAKDVLRQLQSAGLRLDDQLITEALWQVTGEKWKD